MSETTPTGSNAAVNAPSAIGVDEATVRDQVWDATLDLLQRRPLPFQAWRVRKRAALGEEHDRTIRRTLSVMEAAGWLDHEHNSPWWHPGDRAKEVFDVYG